MDDLTLVAAFYKRDEKAISLAKQRYEAYCLSVAEHILRNRQDAEECWNDALLAAWNSIPPQCPENLKTYLGKLTRERAVDCLRKKQAQKRVPAAVLVPFEELEEMLGAYRVEEAAEAAALASCISAFLRTEREAERNVFIRRYWYCDPVAAICARYGYSKGKTVMMLKRTRGRLAAYLKKEGFLYEER